MRSRYILLSVMALRSLLPSDMAADEARFFDFSRFATRSSALPQANPAQSSEESSIGENGIVAHAIKAETHNSNSFLSSSTQRTSSDEGEQTYHATTLRHIDNARPCGPSPIDPAGIQAMVTDAAGKYGVDSDFATAIAWTESRFDQVRNSPKGGRGPMQLLPVTAARFGVADICDPASNIDGGMRYLRTLLDQFKNPILAAAAYNAGEQAIYDNDGVPAYPETVRYVASVINRQLGVGFPGRRLSNLRNQKSPDNTDRQIGSNDVIGARAATFVGGVMQF